MVLSALNFCLLHKEWKENKYQSVTADVRMWAKEKQTAQSFRELSSFFGYLVCCVSPQYSSWTWIRPLLKQRPWRSGVCTRLCLIVFWQATGPCPPAEMEQFCLLKPWKHVYMIGLPVKLWWWFKWEAPCRQVRNFKGWEI